MANVLVVGGAGYVGSHICLSLHRAGHRVTVLDNFTSGHRAAVQWGDCVEGSMEDRGRVAEALRSRAIDAVIHCAASSLIGKSVVEPYDCYAANVSGTLGLLQVMREQGVHRCIFLSTAAVFGEPVMESLDERHPRQPINPYGRSKLAAEHMLEDAAAAYGLRVVALRCFNASGADPDGRIGERHDPETHLIPCLLRKAAGEEIDVRVFGLDYPTRDGSCVRDYIHVDDLAAAHLRALDFTQGREGFHAFNLGSGQGSSVIEVVRATEAIVGRSLDIPPGPRRAGDPAVLVANNAKAREQLGWQPRRTKLHDIISDAWRWQQAPRF